MPCVAKQVDDTLFSTCMLCPVLLNRSMISYFHLYAMSCGTKGGDILFFSCILCCMVQNRSMIPYFAVCKAMVAKFVGDISLSICIYVRHRTFRWHHIFQLYAMRFNIETFRWYHMLTCHVVQERVGGTIRSSCTLCYVA